MAKFTLKNYRPYRLILSHFGPHRFGGPAVHQGVIPYGTDIPLHHLLSLDLSDVNCPVETSSSIQNIPLYYPLKYGQGGPELQYAVTSDTEVEILHISDPKPDDEEVAYVRVPYLPESPAQSIPLSYEEARIVGFCDADKYFQPNPEDMAILRRLGNYVSIGGYQIKVRNSQDFICKNKECEFFGRRVHFEVVATIPAIPVHGADDFWHEFQGGGVDFCFGLCYSCGTVIAINIAN